MFTYIFQEGYSSIFKIGKSDAPESRLNNLNSGSSIGLRKFREIQTDMPFKLEGFLKYLLKHRKVSRHGGKEFFNMLSEDHMNAVLDRAIPLFHRKEAASASTRDFEKLDCRGSLLPASESDVQLLDSLQEVNARLCELEDEASLLRIEKEIVECELKARIGENVGIEGIATWEPSSKRFFCLQTFCQHEPDLYQSVLQRFPALDLEIWREREPEAYRSITDRYPKLDTSAWMQQDKTLYERMRRTYFTPAVTRKLILLT